MKPVIDVWYGDVQRYGQAGRPQRWANILGRVTGPVSSLHYRLNHGESNALTLGPDRRRLAALGDFNIDLDCRNLINGENNIEIIAQSAGGVTVKQVTLIYTESDAILPFKIRWADIKDIQDLAHVVDGLWQLTEHGVSPVEIGYDRLIGIGDMSWQDYEVTVPITIHGINAGCYEEPSIHAGVGIVLRWKGHANWGGDKWANGQPVYGPSPYGAIAWYCVFHDEGGQLNFFDADFKMPTKKPFTLELHQKYFFKARVETLTSDKSKYSLKVWKDFEEEPLDWTLETITRFLGHERGAVLLGAHHTACEFGDINIKNLG